MGGVDFRITRVFGIGPFADFALGQYSGASLKLSAPGRPTVDKNGDLANTALHQWLTLGVRVTFFP